MKDAFNAYREYAWMADELKPVAAAAEQLNTARGGSLVNGPS